MVNIEIYSGNSCPYCHRAKALLERRDFGFTEYDVQRDPIRQTEMIRRAPGARTIPQIFINGRHVGGCDDLYSIDRRNAWSEWLRSP